MDYQVVVQVTRFEADARGYALLDARWSVFGEDGEKELVLRQSSFSKPAGTKDPEARVSAMSGTMANFSREIADAIKALSRKTASLGGMG